MGAINIDPRITVTAKMMVAQRHHAGQFALSSLTKSSSAISGLHQSKFHGRGMDYQESRLYQAGDDIRNMDWKVTAKTGKAHSKLFQEERERPTYIVLDSNSSMLFGTRQQFKSVVAAQIAALLGWASIRYGDRVGVVTYGQNGIHLSKALAGKNGMMRLIAQVVQAYQTDSQVEQRVALELSLKQLRTIIRPGSTVVMISDFQHFGQGAKRHLTQLKKHNDMLAVTICDPFEVYSPTPALYGVRGEYKSIVVDTKKNQVQQQLQHFRQGLVDNLHENIIKNGIPIIPIQTDFAVVDKLKQAFRNPNLAYANWLQAVNHG